MTYPLQHPPGPGGWPWVGIASRFRKDPAAFLLSTAREFGDVSYFRVGLRRVYLVGRPDLVAEVLVHSARYFHRPAIAAPGPSVDTEELVARAVAAIDRWSPESPIDVVSEMKRLCPPAVHRETPDPGEEPRSALDRLATGHADPAEALAAALSWVLISLSLSPDEQQRAREQSGDEYARCIVYEALRLYPPVWVIARTARSQFRLFNYLVPKGSLCLLSPYVTHRLPRFWRDPDRFDPARFLAGERGKFVYFPFGTPELCPGEAAASTALVRITDAVVRRWALRIDSAEPIEPRPAGPLLWPRNAVGVRVSAC
jgi:cytochrome P450